MDHNIIVISILIGVGLYIIYYKFINKVDTSINNLKQNRIDRLKYSDLDKDFHNAFNNPDTNIPYNNVETDEEKLLKYDTNIKKNNKIDHKRIFKKIDNSKYQIPVEGDIYQSVKTHKKTPLDPRAITECTTKLDCNAKKRYDLLIVDDFASMDTFNNNCTREISSYSQETNNVDISTNILNEKPDFYKEISQ